MGARCFTRDRDDLGPGAVNAAPARRVALSVVSRVRERQAYAHETLDAVLKHQRDLDSRDVALATRLSYGTISARGTLDEAIERYTDKPGRLEPRVCDALAISAWELLFGETEPRVAVHEGVELVRGVRPQAAGLANAVLRRLSDAARDFPWGDVETDDSALARLFGHPLWLTRQLIADLGRATAAAVLAANNHPAPLYLAHVPFGRSLDDTLLALTERGAEPVPGPIAGSIELRHPSAIASQGPPLLAEDAIVCDAAAQFAVRALRARPGMRLVEIGAGRGTKTVLAQADAYRAGGFAELWAVDSHAFKVDVLAQTVSRLGLSDHVHPVVADATLLPAAGMPDPGTIDAVLVDAPCSGLGTLRRHPDKRWRLRPDDVETLALLGGSLLAGAAQLVRPKGFMVYSTCTLTRRENGDVIRGFLASESGSGFVVDDVRDDVPDAWLEFMQPEGWFQSLPRRGGADGHFVARLTRV